MLSQAYLNASGCLSQRSAVSLSYCNSVLDSGSNSLAAIQISVHREQTKRQFLKIRSLVC